MHAVKIIIYYAIIAKLPHSRYLKLANKLRLFYLTHVLKVIRESGHVSFFEPGIYIGNGQKVSIGRDCQINENVFMQGAKIGNYVMIAPNASILSKSHNFENLTVPMILQGECEEKIPVIEDDVWLGRNVVVMPGIRIGKGSIVGAGAVVVKDVAPYSIVGGVPARLIRMRQ